MSAKTADFWCRLLRGAAQSTRVGSGHYYKKTAEVVTIELEDRRVARRAKGPIERGKNDGVGT